MSGGGRPESYRAQKVGEIGRQKEKVTLVACFA